MPTIQSRKYPEKDVQFVDAGTWDTMVKKGLSRRFRVVDDGDLQDTITPSSINMVDFTQEKEPEPDRKEIRAKLDELEVEYNKYASTDTLLLLLNEQNTE